MGSLVALSEYAEYMDIKIFHSLVNPGIPLVDTTSGPVNGRFERMGDLNVCQ